jgi:hypothetical protein
MTNDERNPNEPMRKCWLVRYGNSRLTIREFGILPNQSEQEQEDAHEALTRHMCLMMLSPNCEHPPSPRLRRKRGLVCGITCDQ